MSSSNQPTATPQGVAVSLARHGGLRWRRPQGWAFAKQRRLVPITPPDAMAMASAFALVFAGDGFVPCAVLGLGGAHHAYIGADGTWLGAAIPPMLRAYPFDVVPHGTADLMLTVDEASGLLDQSPQSAPFFDAAGGPSPQMKEIIAFCRKHGDAGRRAAPAVAAINAHGLFDAMGAGMFGINTARFHALKDEDILALRQVGALDLIYAHIVSMAHLAWLQQAEAMPKRAKGPMQNDADLNSFLAAMLPEAIYEHSAQAGFSNASAER